MTRSGQRLTQAEVTRREVERQLRSLRAPTPPLEPGQVLKDLGEGLLDKLMAWLNAYPWPARGTGGEQNVFRARIWREAAADLGGWVNDEVMVAARKYRLALERYSFSRK